MFIIKERHGCFPENCKAGSDLQTILVEYAKGMIAIGHYDKRAITYQAGYVTSLTINEN